MSSDQPSAPPLDTSAATIVKRLRTLSLQIRRIQASIMVCSEVLQAQAADLDPEVAIVLRHAASNPLHTVLNDLHDWIVQFASPQSTSEDDESATTLD